MFGIARLDLLLVFLVVLLSNLTTSLPLDLDFQDECIQGCPFQNRTDDTLHFGVGCGNDCNIEQCSLGCKLWRSALESSCQTVCNGTQELLPPKQLYCVIGCNDAVTRYLNELRHELGGLPAPALVADSLTATSLRLEWSWHRHQSTSQQSHIKYLVQWRYEELAAAWQYCRNQTWSSQHDTVFVDNLQPYTKYRFRVAVLLWPSYAGEPVVSEPSVVISTLPMGFPSSAPRIIRAVAVDSSRISISWEPGPFPNGPILSYVLQIVSRDNHPVLKDIPALNNTDFYMFKHLLPSRNYSLSVSMRNGVGEGPAASVTVATPSEYIVDQTVPILILGAHHSVIQQSADMLEEPLVLYNTTRLIKGVAVHVTDKLLFISDSSGYVWRTSLGYPETGQAGGVAIIRPELVNFLPLDLSVDWLNDQLYILGEVRHLHSSRVWQIVRCSLDGRTRTVAMAGFVTKPHHIEVDPYNGYLFWVNAAGLWRLDLADISNGIRREILPMLLLEVTNLGAFTVDHTNFRLLVPHHQNNTVISVSLDGREVIDIRNNTQKPMFTNVLSIAMANGLFYWTNGNEVIAEEYNHHDDNYFHNTYPDLSDRSFVSLTINVPASQPIPVPVNPPTSVQAILGSTKAKVSWQIPHLLGGQGKGAWQNWSYELHVRDSINGSSKHHSEINTTSFTMEDLRENTEYIFKTTAYTRSGKGPWSSEFRGKTLNIPSDAKFLWSAEEGLLRSDVTGDNVHTLIHKTNEYHITDITWFHNTLYMATNNTQVYCYDLINHKKTKLVEIDSASSIAIDWIGRKLYWSNPKQQLITRGNLNGGQHEPLPILTLARELNVDSINAYIYWSTGHAVECARLNGAERRTYYPAQLFSGKQVMGLTLSIEEHYLYWVVRSYEGSILFRASTAESLALPSNEIPIARQHQLQHPDMQGPLCFFSQRLLWLQDPNNAVIGDLDGRNAAVLSGTRLSGLKMVTVIDDTLHKTPPNTTKIINVIPKSVAVESISIVGSWNAFNITWTPVSNVNYGQVFYEVKTDDHRHIDSLITTSENTVLYQHQLMPYSKLEVAVRAFTYWGSAPQSRTYLHSPPSTPSKPQFPRVYIAYNRHPFHERDITAIFRWGTPQNTNGVIRGYIVKCWFEADDGSTIYVYDYLILPPNQFEFLANHLSHNLTYYFQVQAFTEVGQGNSTNPVSISTSTESYIPKLLIAFEDVIVIKDFDSNESTTVAKSNGKIIDIAYIFIEKKIIWLNDLHEIFISNFDKSNRTKLVTLNGYGVNIAVDWVKRSIFWVQFDFLTRESSIYTYDLNTAVDGIVTIRNIITLPTMIHHIEVSPSTSTLFWTASSQNGAENVLMASDYFGSNVRPIFSPHNVNHDSCNCSLHAQIEKKFTVYTPTFGKPKIIFADYLSRSIIETDTRGCMCVVLAQHPFQDPIDSVTAERSTVYALSKGQIFTNRNDSNIWEPLAEIISTIGSHKQLYPPSYCLVPLQESLVAKMHNKSANWILLEMPEPIRNSNCLSFSMPVVQYRVYYMPYNTGDSKECDETCTVISTYDKFLKVTGLRPFSQYLFSLAITNYYNEMREDEIIIWEGVVLSTAAGAPSKAEEVIATVLNPTSIKVDWSPPTELNDETVWYEVHWVTEEAIAGVRQKGELNTKNFCGAHLSNLLPNHTYSIWVRTHSQNSQTYTDSERVQVETYAAPNNITLINATAYSIQIAWEKSKNVTSHVIKFTKLGMSSWSVLREDAITDISGDIYYYSIRHLQPKSQYKFQLLLKYLHFEGTYLWPGDSRFKFSTLADKPSAPGIPMVQHVHGDVYQMTWEPGQDNGSPISQYRLEGRSNGAPKTALFDHKIINRKKRQSLNENQYESNEIYSSNATISNNDQFSDLILKLSNERPKRDAQENYSRLHIPAPSIDEDEIEWETYYNGSKNYWLISDLIPNQKYWFRVTAHNEYGWGPYSNVSEGFEPGSEASGARLAHRPQQLTMILAIVVPILVILFIISICGFLCLCNRREKDNKTPQSIVPITTLGPDVELATLRDMPRGRPGGTFIHSTNILYTSSDAPINNDSTDSLPHIRRDQITLTKFLGSGAFGEVFEGKAKALDGIAGETRVAVKTLRKGASCQERAEFLSEAQLMAHFRHKHILRLLGVCRDNDPHFIIMELMQAGDLLSYLRTSRPLLQTSQALTLLDLLAMCVDVAKGCCYLEEQHFVHRDLACRNCLVSSSDPAVRVVKIGDFGLARDIYKNDYYRKEGEGLLPVRWMAPESLVDGVFTSQSDVWAFGVLMWEIMTLGQQPYPARTNLEVLHYVRNGGRLHRPNDCPEDLHQLMLKCWTYNPEVRPTFKYCLEVLEMLQQHGTAVTTCLANPSYMLDFNSNCPSMSVAALEEVETASLSHTTANPEVPKYLELIYDTEDAPDSMISADGYEIPRSSIRSRKSISTESTASNYVRPLSVNSLGTNFNSNQRFPRRIVRSNSTICSSRSTSMPRGTCNRIGRSNSVTRQKSATLSGNLTPHVTDIVCSNSAVNSGFLPRRRTDISSERLLPPQISHSVKFCTYSNVAQAHKPLLKDAPQITMASDEARQSGNRRSFNSHSVC